MLRLGKGTYGNVFKVFHFILIHTTCIPSLWSRTWLDTMLSLISSCRLRTNWMDNIMLWRKSSSKKSQRMTAWRWAISVLSVKPFYSQLYHRVIIWLFLVGSRSSEKSRCCPACCMWMLSAITLRGWNMYSPQHVSIYCCPVCLRVNIHWVKNYSCYHNRSFIVKQTFLLQILRPCCLHWSHLNRTTGLKY